MHTARRSAAYINNWKQTQILELIEPDELHLSELIVDEEEMGEPRSHWTFLRVLMVTPLMRNRVSPWRHKWSLTDASSLIADTH